VDGSIGILRFEFRVVLTFLAEVLIGVDGAVTLGTSRDFVDGGFARIVGVVVLVFKVCVTEVVLTVESTVVVPRAFGVHGGLHYPFIDCPLI